MSGGSIGCSSGEQKGPVRAARIQLTDEQRIVIDAVEAGKSVFITGKAGTGKVSIRRRFVVDDVSSESFCMQCDIVVRLI
jgi:hypothetical protein